MTRLAPPVTVLQDRRDDVEVTHTLLDAHDPAAGVVTVHPTPGAAGAAALATDILQALGRPITRLATERLAGPAAWAAAAAWIHADDITHLVVLRAHHLTAEQLQTLLQIRQATEVHLVLVRHTRVEDPVFDLQLADLPQHRTDRLGGVAGVLATAIRTPEPTAELDIGELAAVPGSDPAGFRTEAYRTLDSDDFARVDAVYHDGIRCAYQYLAKMDAADHAPGRHVHDALMTTPAPDEPDFHQRPLRRAATRRRRQRLTGREHDREEATLRDEQRRPGASSALRGFLASLVADSPGPNYSVARLRGAQAGFGLHGWSLALSPNLPYTVGPGLTTTPMTRAVVDRIRGGLANPVSAAALATAMFTGCLPRELTAIPAAALTDDAATIRYGEDARAYAVPRTVRRLLLAARTFQELRDTDRYNLFEDGITGHRLRTWAMACELRLPARHPWTDTWLGRAAAERLGPRNSAATRTPHAVRGTHRSLPRPSAGNNRAMARNDDADQYDPTDTS